MNWNIYIGFWTLMKCTQYGLYEQAAFNPGEGQHHGIEEIMKRCPDLVGRETKSFRGQWRWWAPPASVTPDRARWGPFSVRHICVN